MKKKNIIAEPSLLNYETQISGSQVATELILKRLKTGEYISQIKNLYPLLSEDEIRAALHRELKLILSEVRSELKNLYNDNLVNIVLYGSYARGDYNQKSDIDLLVVLKNIQSIGKEIDKIVDAIYDINLKYNTLISIVPITYKDYKNINSPLLLNVREEGVLVE